MDKQQERVTYGKLFISMLMISAMTFGGGFVMIGMMKKKYCEELHWIDENEVLDMTAIAQSAPGALAVNSAIIFGYRMKGITGALVATAGVILPPLVIITLISMFYAVFQENYIVQIALQVMRAGVAAIILDVVFDLAKDVIHQKNWLNVILMVAAFIASWLYHVSAITLIILFLAMGIGMSILQSKKAGDHDVA